MASVQSLGDKLNGAGATPGADADPLQRVTVPDLWQQQAVAALRAGRDVVIDAPTGAGKTLIFELWSQQGRPRGQAIYTVPTRALANDKRAEWTARGWDVGIATGDLAENLGAPVVVATLETQKNRLIQGAGPALLVVDEYQMLGDADRGLNYELALALAPERTQLLLLSGSVANPQAVVAWLRRLGRDAELVRHTVRPVPLEEVFVNQIGVHLPREIRGAWSRVAARALADGLGPVLLFAPRRAQTEQVAAEIARELPNPNPLNLSPDQKRIAGEHLARMLRSRVAYHHSGLSYAVRAGVIEPLAKAGQLRVVVATMGLAAGINFSLRSVAITAASYKRDGREVPIEPDEILQMLGRAGRRGLDDTGYVLVTANDLRLRDGQPAQLARSGMVDWSALLSLMAAAAAAGRDPYREAVRVQQRLFTTKPIFLGVEDSLRHPDTPCGLRTDAERARHVRKQAREMLNSRGEWQPLPPPEDRPLAEARVLGPAEAHAPPGDTPAEGPAPDVRPALSEPAALEKTGDGGIAELETGPGGRVFGRSLIVAERLGTDRVLLSKWVRRLTQWKGREAAIETWHATIAPQLRRHLAAEGRQVVRFDVHPRHVVALVSVAALPVRVRVDRHGVALWRPPEREVFPPDCARCDRVEACRRLDPATGTALLWKRLGLVDPGGVPTLRGRVTSFYTGGDGLAIAAALEDPGYPLDELLFDLANLDAGFRFCGEDHRWGGRLALACQRVFGFQNIPGYLENGLPPKYGDGANSVVQTLHRDPRAKHRFITEFLGVGDIDRVIIEWRSLLRQTANAPPLDWARWNAFQQAARTMLQRTESPTETRLPPLEAHQVRRIDHRLRFQR